MLVSQLLQAQLQARAAVFAAPAVAQRWILLAEGLQ